jgi:hypothetical protein
LHIYARSAGMKWYLHTMHMEFEQTHSKVTFSQDNPFGVPGRDYSATYPVTCEELIPMSPMVVEALQVACDCISHDVNCGPQGIGALTVLQEVLGVR